MEQQNTVLEKVLRQANHLEKQTDVQLKGPIAVLGQAEKAAKKQDQRKLLKTVQAQKIVQMKG